MTNDFLIMDGAFGDDFGTKFDQMCDNGADGFIWRLGQGLPPYPTAETDDVTKQVATCVRRSKPYAFYYPPHPWSDPTDQAIRTLNLAFANGYKPKFIWADLELKGNMTDAQVSGKYKTYCYYLRDHSPVPVGVYSGNWCIEGWFPSVKEWVFEFPLWLASYTAWGRNQTNNWTQFTYNFDNLSQLSYTGYPVIPAYQFANQDGARFLGANADYTKIADSQWFNYFFSNGPDPRSSTQVPVVVRKYRVTNFPGTYVRSQPSWSTGVNVKILYYLETGIIIGETTNWWQVAGGYVDKRRAIEIK